MFICRLDELCVLSRSVPPEPVSLGCWEAVHCFLVIEFEDSLYILEI